MLEVPVAITAVGAVTALGLGPDCLFDGLLAGVRGFGRVERFGVNGCRVQLAAEVRGDLPVVGSTRTADLAVTAVRNAIAKLPPFVDLSRVGVVLGSAGAGTAGLEDRLLGIADAPALLRRYTKRELVDEVARSLGFGGPRHAINTACSSGAMAVALAADWLRFGDCDVAIAVGADELGRFTYTGFHALRAMDPEPCRPFDRHRQGLTMGEGAGCVVLERPREARRRGAPIRAFLGAVGQACDAHHLTAPDPSGAGPARAIARALEGAGVEPREVGFINAHGTGTPLNDAAEVSSIEVALGAAAVECPVHSVKATVGHCMGAAGAIEAVVAVLSLERQLVPHTAGLTDCEFDGRVRCVRGEPLHVEADFALSTSFGFGGNDAAILLAHPRVFEEGT
ncbi:MAG: beta-ketoacyl-[acyl-carrier-protein] synthase family protein [Anaeromyxobacter sp.]